MKGIKKFFNHPDFNFIILTLFGMIIILMIVISFMREEGMILI